MAVGKATSKLFSLAVFHVLWICPTDAEHRPFTRAFSMGGEERYSVTISLKAQTQSVSIETVGSKSYLLPALHFGEVRLKRHIARRIRSVKSDGTAEIEEVNETAS